MKASELTGAKLDYWVAKAEGFEVSPYKSGHRIRQNGDYFGYIGNRNDPTLLWIYSPSTDWSQGGPILERDGLGVTQHNNIPDRPDNRWICTKYQGGMQVGIKKSMFAFGPTPLIAAMRCLVASKYGDEVPDEETKA
jgi:hypothetical protein